MTDSKATMHQIRFWLGLCPRPRWGAYSAPPDHLAGFGGPTFNGRGREREGRGKRGEGEGRGGEGKGGEGRGGEVKGHEPPPTIWRKFTPMGRVNIWLQWRRHTRCRKIRNIFTHDFSVIYKQNLPDRMLGGKTAQFELPQKPMKLDKTD